MQNKSNDLINETSPYLLQHAYNPVDWKPWGDAAFQKARDENKLIILSVGYSACHWCHVMEKESFEDSATAALMNKYYVSVKVDREERPDVDQVYMSAVQLMTGHGGWPMNVVLLPDGRPIWGGTYFPRSKWQQALKSVSEFYQHEPGKVLEYAEKLTAGVVKSQLIEINPDPPSFSKDEAATMMINWQSDNDTLFGGSVGAPKFPMPANSNLLLHFSHISDDKASMRQLKLNLKAMAYGGIYDQLRGGFARYSTDEKWKVPHFEKMLYDNSQLISLYSKAFQKTKDPLYKKVVEESMNWIIEDMTGEYGEFYSAIDADSEGEEGKFYVWTESELKAIIPPNEWDEFSAFFDLKEGYWENGKIILLRNLKTGTAPSEKSKDWQQRLLKEREKRIAPGIDDKALSSWNAMMITACLNAYVTFQNDVYLNVALANAEWLMKYQMNKDGSLNHSFRKGESKIEGLLEDYVFAIEAFLKLFEVTFDEKHLRQAESWNNFIQKNFLDSTSWLFYMRNLNSKQLIAKSLETADNVIPSANSVMAHNLFLLSHYLGNEGYRAQAEKMLNQVKGRMINFVGSFSNWGTLLLKLSHPFYELAIAGDDAHAKHLQWYNDYHPNVVIIGTDKESYLPLLDSRYETGKTLLYLCENKVCQMPVEDLPAVRKMLN